MKFCEYINVNIINVLFVMKLLILCNICIFRIFIMILELKNCCNWFFYKYVFFIFEDDMMLLRFILFFGYKDDV